MRNAPPDSKPTFPSSKPSSPRQWGKEDELKQLKSELAALDRKITAELAPKKEEQDGEEVKRDEDPQQSQRVDNPLNPQAQRSRWWRNLNRSTNPMFRLFARLIVLPDYDTERQATPTSLPRLSVFVVRPTWA